MSLKVLIVDDHKLMAAALKQTLDSVEHIRVVGLAHSGSDAITAVTRTQPDVVVLDVNMPGMGGLECLDLIQRDYPSVKVVMLSAGDDMHVIRDAFTRGAAAFIVKSVDPEDLPAALRHVCAGTVYHAPTALNATAPDPLQEAGLTERELSMLKAVARGLSNKAISKEFWVTEQTVKFHLNNVYRKLGVANRTAAAGFVHEHHLLESATV
jgi:DNA-binding NarL/FixJ family response regulator